MSILGTLANKLYQAAQSGDLNTVQELLQLGINIRAWNNNVTALMLAACYGHLDVVKALIAAGANVNMQESSGYTALALASQQGHTKVVEELLNAKCEIDTKDNLGGCTPLYRACHGGHLDIVQLLLLRGADRNIRTTNTGDTPITTASWRGHTAVVKLLLEHGSSVQEADNEGFTALHCATEIGSDETVKLLLQHGADVKARNKYEDTPLHRTSANGYLSTTKLLLEEGDALCTITLKGYQGWTPEERARDKGHMEVVHYLEQVQSGKIKVNKEEDMCNICMDATIDCVLLECGHVMSCTPCGKRLRQCPICRKKVVRVVHTYRS